MTKITTIAVDSKTMSMACDLQGTIGGSHKIKLSTKIWKISGNEFMYPGGEFLVGMSGSADEMMEIVDFYANPEHYKKPPRMTGGAGSILTDRGDIYYFSSPGKWLRVRDKVHSVGSGCLTAMGALHAGATPKQAVQAAMKVDPFTGMGTKVYKF